ncbi:CLUMA_CG012484, isoform A [Clunio marinus]|uniref:CLUMA_CG012484, isoform A n=1 Tax=Clunio marinus TaxID=568069 RepID=A0A1J1IG01_9DIPT|nr:CLUMA_CG012484, isoform A [Clunio marinus]
MNHKEPSMNSLENESKNYKSLYEEIAQNDSKIYLNSTMTDNFMRYGDETDQCCCCKIHRRQHNNIIAGGAVTKAFTIPIYNTIWIGEMKNATDYIEYLNQTRRNSFISLNKDYRSNFYKLMVCDYNSLNNDITHHNISNNNDIDKNLLQVPQLHTDEELRKTPEFDDISKKIEEINTLDTNVSTLIYKSIEVHADILTLDATVSRLLAETRKLLEEIEDVKCLDEIIDMLNSEIPIIHREWRFIYAQSNVNKIPVDEGIMVSCS